MIVAKQWTVKELRRFLDGLPEDMVVELDCYDVDHEGQEVDGTSATYQLVSADAWEEIKGLKGHFVSLWGRRTDPDLLGR